MQITSLECRRERGDLINVYKMVNGLDRVGRELLRLDGGAMRGHGKKLRKERMKVARKWMRRMIM